MRLRHNDSESIAGREQCFNSKGTGFLSLGTEQCKDQNKAGTYAARPSYSEERTQSWLNWWQNSETPF